MNEQQATVIQQIQEIQGMLTQLPDEKLVVVLDFISFLLAQAQIKLATVNGVREGKVEYVITPKYKIASDDEVMANVERSLKEHAATWAELAKH